MDGQHASGHSRPRGRGACAGRAAGAAAAGRAVDHDRRGGRPEDNARDDPESIGGPLEYAELPLPEPDRGQIRLRVEACGVCRTDLHIIDGELRESRLPLVPGHELVGRIERMGGDMHGLRLGQRVGVPWLSRSCGTCPYCRAGCENLCDAADFTGFTVNGGYAEACLAEARSSLRWTKMSRRRRLRRCCVRA
ncbi:alcohol dehydrogenase catalytic domain-containing protein [Paracoccus sp. T5]|uniref:alcohol dehydrogenase catalytic domain-containing protein n=1 Tax=Paracoccus sp. T5 TaxID=3402161 RepID=UPI003AE9FC50